jgi:hypothetical protein
MFISPVGENSFVQSSHINTVINNPGLFGLTLKEIQKKYDDYSEPLGIEGKAREELLKQIIRTGWIRLRRYTNRQWSVTVDKYSGSNKHHVRAWATEIMSGQLGQTEADAYMPVVITQLDPPHTVVMPLLELSWQELS